MVGYERVAFSSPQSLSPHAGSLHAGAEAGRGACMKLRPGHPRPDRPARVVAGRSRPGAGDPFGDVGGGDAHRGAAVRCGRLRPLAQTLAAGYILRGHSWTWMFPSMIGTKPTSYGAAPVSHQATTRATAAAPNASQTPAKLLRSVCRSRPSPLSSTS